MTPAHGTISCYNNHHCRCPLCRAALAAYHRKQRAARRATPVPDKQIPHGTRTGYIDYHCRCEPCTTANRDYKRDLRARRDAERRAA